MIDSSVMRVEKAELVRVLHAEPTLGEMFTAYLLTRNSRIEGDLVDQLFNSHAQARDTVGTLTARSDRRATKAGQQALNLRAVAGPTPWAICPQC
jgi:hypothetical protein